MREIEGEGGRKDGERDSERVVGKIERVVGEIKRDREG